LSSSDGGEGGRSGSSNGAQGQNEPVDANSNIDTDTTIRAINAEGMSLEEIRRILDEEEALMEEAERSRIVKNWKPGMRRRPLQVSYRIEDFGPPPADDEGGDPSHQHPWTLRDRRTGALAIKVGMVPVFDGTWGVRYPCTVLLLDENVVVGHKVPEKHGYTGVVIGAGRRKRKNVGPSVLGQYRSSIHLSENEDPPYLLREFRITMSGAAAVDAEQEAVLLHSRLPPVGSRIHASHFVPGQNVDVSGISSGKGFQGGMKRHGFGGLPASHGVSRAHRSIGSTGQCQDPGKVFKGKKMPGRMGGVRVTTQNLRVVKIDRGRNLLYVHGSVPGKSGSFVEIRDAVKRPLWGTDLVKDGMERPPVPTFAYDPEVDGCGLGGHEVFMPLTDADPLAPDEEAA
jgi:large subunit ribosomal protein L3